MKVPYLQRLCVLGIVVAMSATSCSSPTETNPSIPGLQTTWHSGTIESTVGPSWLSVAYGNGTFVAAAYYPFSGGTTGKVATSIDGIQWTVHQVEGNPLWFSIAYGNGIFVMVAAGPFEMTNNVATSYDGVNWALATLPGEDCWQSVAYGNGVFVAMGETSLATSVDGVNWTRTTSAASTLVSFAGGQFRAPPFLSTDNGLYSSANGTDWTWSSAPTATQSGSYWRGFASGNGVTVALAGGLSQIATSATSSNPSTWTVQDYSNHDPWWIISFGDGVFLAAGNGTENNVGFSHDGVSWTPLTVQGGGFYALGSQIVFADHRFVIVAQDGTTKVCEIEETS